MSKTELIFSSQWLKDPLGFRQHLDDFQFAIIDKMAEQNADTLVVTTTRDMDTGFRNHWTVGTEYEDSALFYKELMNDSIGSLDVFEDDDGFMYARYLENGRSSIWKFHFINDVENLIDHTLSHLGSFFFEDFRDTIEYAFQDGGYLSYNEQVSIELVAIQSTEGEFFLTLPYMQEPIIHGILYYDNSTSAWMLEDGTVSFDDAFDTYIDECLY